MSEETVAFSLTAKAHGAVDFAHFRTIRYLRAMQRTPAPGSDTCTPGAVVDVLAKASLLRLEGKKYDSEDIDTAELNLIDDERRQFAMQFLDTISKSAMSASV
jgi:hypothetical protein